MAAVKISILPLALVMAAGPAVATPLDKYRITPEEHAACDSDAVVLCAFTYPDEDRLIGCMKTNLRKLSDTCSAAFVAGLKRRHLSLPD